jgi:hypothetical protein
VIETLRELRRNDRGDLILAHAALVEISVGQPKRRAASKSKSRRGSRPKRS